MLAGRPSSLLPCANRLKRLYRPRGYRSSLGPRDFTSSSAQHARKQHIPRPNIKKSSTRAQAAADAALGDHRPRAKQAAAQDNDALSLRSAARRDDAANREDDNDAARRAHHEASTSRREVIIAAGPDGQQQQQQPTSYHTLSAYLDTVPPNSKQLRYATDFFTRRRPKFLHGTSAFKTLPVSSLPEVAFIGRSNVGKSSLINALLGSGAVAHVSRQPGRTKEMNAFGVGGVELIKGRPEVLESAGTRELEDGERTKAFDRWAVTGEGRRQFGGAMVLVDMPGYGFGSRDEWGREILKYLEQRKQLKRVFVLIGAKTGPKETDEQMFELLQRSAVPFQVVITKTDELFKVKSNGRKGIEVARLEERRKEAERVVWRTSEEAGLVAGGGGGGSKGLRDVIVTSTTAAVTYPQMTAKRAQGAPKIGMDELRWAILQATGLEADERGKKKATADFVVQQQEEEEDEGEEEEEEEYGNRSYLRLADEDEDEDEASLHKPHRRAAPA